MRQNLENIKKGLIYIKDKDYIKAEIFFLNLVRKNPSDVQIYSYLIPVLIEQKKFSDALKFSERLFNLNKKNELGLIYIGIINYNLKEYPLAFEFFERALLINPKNFDALLKNAGDSINVLTELVEVKKMTTLKAKMMEMGIDKLHPEPEIDFLSSVTPKRAPNQQKT